MKPVLELKDITKTYGKGHAAVEAVKKSNLKVFAKEVVVIMGPSGSGKTTLLSISGCLLTPSTGGVYLTGQNVTELPQRKLADFRLKHIGFVFQAFNLLAPLTALGNVEIAFNLAGHKGKKAKEKAASLLSELGLAKRLNHKPEDLSGGEKQRVAVARALANEPELILADEPTGNLDSKSGHQVVKLLHDVAKKRGSAVVVVSYDMRIMDIADRVLRLEDGQIKTPEELATDPVCGMTFSHDEAVAKTTHKGKVYHFCSKTCLEKFEENPEQYLSV